MRGDSLAASWVIINDYPSCHDSLSGVLEVASLPPVFEVVQIVFLSRHESNRESGFVYHLRRSSLITTGCLTFSVRFRKNSRAHLTEYRSATRVPLAEPFSIL